MRFSRASGGLTRRDVLRGITAAGVGVAAGAGAHGFFYERHRLEITRVDVAVSGLPAALSGVRMGFLTDIHRSETVSHAFVDAAVRLLISERPDIAVLGGDYVSFNDRRFMRPAAEALAPLTAPHGVFAVLGNHDDDREMPAALSDHGIEVLRDARTRLTIRGETLDLIGIRYWTRRLSEIARAAQGAAPASILLAHTPSRLTEAAALGIPLMLSGHTHGGQVVLPLLGPIAAQGFPIVAGTGRRDNTAAFVSRGIGTVYLPIRINCPPEVAIVTLRPVEQT